MQTDNSALEAPDIHESGGSRLWGWFGLSYASFLVLPRVAMHEMPDEWQAKMTDLLEEYDAAFPNQPELSTRVNAVNPRTSKMTKWPAWILNYRRPDVAAVNAMRQH